MTNATKHSSSPMRAFVLLFGVLSYSVFFAAFLYEIGFVGNFWVPKGIDDGAASSATWALGVNLVLLGLFAVQHTIMARHAFKSVWTRVVPRAIERSIFVLLSSLLLLLLSWQWVPLSESVWDVEGFGAGVLNGVCVLGWALVFVSTFLINHFDLLGLRQVWLFFRGVEYAEVPFKEGYFYGWVRHPIMLGFILAFWGAPHMTQGHLLFAAVTTIYILIGIRFEERTLGSVLGDDYQEYRKRVPLIVPWPPRRG